MVMQLSKKELREIVHGNLRRIFQLFSNFLKDMPSASLRKTYVSPCKIGKKIMFFISIYCFEMY